MKKILVFVFILMVSTSYAYAKNNNSMDMTNSSVQLLKKLNDEGKIIREKDAPITKAYTEEDTYRTRKLKEVFSETGFKKPKSEE